VCKAGGCGSGDQAVTPGAPCEPRAPSPGAALPQHPPSAPAPSICPIYFQIARLEQTWIVLRQRHTEGAILYEKKLKPFLKSLNEGKGNGSNSPLLACLLLPASSSTALLEGMHLRALTLSQPAPDASPPAADPPRHPAGPVWPRLPLPSRGSIS